MAYNATFLDSHAVDKFQSASFGIDMTDFINSSATPAEFVATLIDNFKKDVASRIMSAL